ncbi:MAG: RHS repeat-associated core domain-containing protein [Burkholderiales bacterium]
MPTSKVNTADANDRTTYTWDSQQRLTQVSAPELTAVYQYDLLGRRVQRQITKPGFPPETTHYVYDGLQAVGEIRPQQSSTSLMTGLNLDEMLARVTTLNATNTTQARTYLTDALGSVMAQTQDNQSTLAGYSYSPYGQTQGTGNTEGDSVQYTGRENDNNGLYYYRARYYDPVLKRFLSEDPIGLAGGSLSFYSYVGGNPLSYTDPEGLQKTMPRPVVPVIPGPRNGSQQDADNGGEFGRSRDGGRSREREQRDGGGDLPSCKLIKREAPGSYLNQQCKYCWNCMYSCGVRNVTGGGDLIVRYQIGGCVEMNGPGYVPGFDTSSQCEAAAKSGQKGPGPTVRGY